MDISTIRKNNLKALIAKVGSQSELAKVVGTNRLYLSQILSDVTPRDLGTKLARRIEVAMGLPSGYMDADHTGEPSSAPQAKRMLPELSEAQVLKFQMLDAAPESSGIQVSFTDVGDHAFAYRVGKQEVTQVPAGSMVYVDPEVKPRSDDVVLVGSETANRVFIRRLDVGLVGKPRLVSDTTGESVEMPEGTKIVGVVREVSLRLR